MNSLRIIMGGYLKDELKMKHKIENKNDLLERNEIRFKELSSVKKNLDIQKIRYISIEYDLNQRDKTDLKKGLIKLSKKMDNLIGQITEVHKDVKLLESLKEKRQQDIDKEVVIEEHKMNDEAANNQYLRKIKGFIVVILLLLSQGVVNAGNIAKQTNLNSSSPSYENQIKESISDLNNLKTKVTEEQNRLKALIKRYNNAKLAMEAAAKQLKNRNYKMIGNIYGNTDPQSSANSLSMLSAIDAAKILSSMPGRKAGKILSVMKPDSASKITLEMIKLGIIK